MTVFHADTPQSLQTACDNAMAGDTIAIAPGRYDRPSVLRNKQGPITICPGAAGVISGGQWPDPFWGEGKPHEDSPGKPSLNDFAFLIMRNCRDIVIEKLEIKDCWPSVFFIKDSARITIRKCRLKHGVFAIYVRGEAPADKHHKTYGYIIEGNEWQQDDSSDHKLWSLYDWKRSHGNEGSDGRYRYFNGAFFGGKNIAGGVFISGNCIADAYNGVRLKAADAPPEGLPCLNADVFIFDNNFIRIRDNPIEPEVYAVDWHVWHNRLLDCHSWFSFDGVAGGYWYFYGNTGRFETRQGEPFYGRTTIGRILKLSYDSFVPDKHGSAVPSRPWYVFNNSWYLRCPIISGSDVRDPAATEGPDFTSHLDFFNNAMQWCDPYAHPDGVCDLRPMISHFDWQRSENVSFDHDICNRSNFKSYMCPPGGDGEPHGIVASAPIFRDAPAGKFELAELSQAANAGVPRKLALSHGSGASIFPNAEGTLNMGAVQDYGLTSVPALEKKARFLRREIEVNDEQDFS